MRQFKTLLHAFEFRPIAKTFDSGSIEQHKALLHEFGLASRQWEKEQFYSASDFNILQTLGVAKKELCHSDVLAWLLDHRLHAYGSHAQQECGFRLFLQEFGLPPKYLCRSYRVRREVVGSHSRLDIVIEADGRFVIGIENKVDSEEGENQTLAEWDDLKKRGRALNVPDTAIHALFLTPSGHPPQSRHFKAVSWQSIANVFEKFSHEAKPEMVKLFARHYAETLRRFVISNNEREE